MRTNILIDTVNVANTMNTDAEANNAMFSLFMIAVSSSGNCCDVRWSRLQGSEEDRWSMTNSDKDDASGICIPQIPREGLDALPQTSEGKNHVWSRMALS